MKVYILMFAEPYNDKEILGTFSTLDDAFEALCNSQIGRASCRERV